MSIKEDRKQYRQGDMKPPVSKAARSKHPLQVLLELGEKETHFVVIRKDVFKALGL